MSGDAEAPPGLIAYDLGYADLAIRPAETRRAWMDESPEGFAYRCLPLTMANGHGWEIVGDSDVEAVWDGGQFPANVRRVVHKHGHALPISHFGAGVLTWHIGCLFRTDPGFNLWMTGPPNTVKDGIVPLSGLIETDWSPMSATMNWRFTRPNHVVRFEAGEPFCFVFPVPRHLVPDARPEIRPISSDPETAAEHEAWRLGRGRFNREVKCPGSDAAKMQWQKTYHRGLYPSDGRRAPEHRTKVGARPFRRVEG